MEKVLTKKKSSAKIRFLTKEIIMATKMTPMLLEMAADLEPIDRAMTQVINNNDLRKRFFEDPNGVMIELGVHAPTSPEISARVNKFIYATLLNSKLHKIVEAKFQTIQPKSAGKNEKHFREGLKKGVVQNLVEYDLEIVNECLADEKFLRAMYSTSLHDLNERGLLTKTYPDSEIDDYVKRVVVSVMKHEPIKDRPKLEEYDRNYGVGCAYGAVAFEAGAVVTVLEVVEVVQVGTVAIPVLVFGLTGVKSQISLSANSVEELNSVIMLTRLLEFGAEMVLHAKRFENRW